MSKLKDRDKVIKRIVTLSGKVYSYPHINLVLESEGFAQLPVQAIGDLASGKTSPQNKRDARVIELAGKKYSYRHINIVLRSENITPVSLGTISFLVGRRKDKENGKPNN